METHFEKYLDARFESIDAKINHIDEKLNTFQTNVDTRFNRMDGDIKEIRSDIKGLRSWYIGTSLVIVGILIGLITYHAQVMQSQMAFFADYVKTVTQPQK